MDEMAELLAEFRAESQDILARVREALRLLAESEPGIEEKAEAFRELTRGIHTIKGGAGMFGMAELTEKVHKLESYLLKFKESPHKLTPKQIASVSRYVDGLEGMIEQDPQAAAGEASSHGLALPDEAAAVSPGVVSEPIAEAQAPAPMPMESTDSESKDLLGAKTTKTAADSAVSHKARASSPDLIRVPVERLQRNLDTVTEIFLIRNQMSFLVDSMLRKTNGRDVPLDAFLHDWESLDSSLRKSIGELEQIAMGLRMMPMRSLFQRMEKTVRAYADTTPSKQIVMEMHGEDTELDKKILDHLSEPLIHLIRNAMDHGIETSEERQQRGKAMAGCIRLGAEVRGNEVILTIADDGKGIDDEKVLASAKRKGLDVSHVRSREQAIDLIFLPGFSTADVVSEVSGRGVGMDAVKTFVESIGGSLVVTTQKGQGSTFTLTLPLGMSLIPAIVAKINDDIYAIASNDVLETMRLPRRAVMTNDGQHFIDYKGRLIPCFFLDHYLAKKSPGFLHVLHPKISVCVVKSQDELVALCVSEFLSNTEIATKPLPAMAPKLPYVTGASILVTGEPALVLSMRRLHQWLLGQVAMSEKGAARGLA